MLNAFDEIHVHPFNSNKRKLIGKLKVSRLAANGQARVQIRVHLLWGTNKKPLVFTGGFLLREQDSNQQEAEDKARFRKNDVLNVAVL